MKLLFLLLALLAIASPAEARHHRHAQQHHASAPLPQPRPVQQTALDALGARLFTQLQPEWRQASPDNPRRIGLQILALSMVTR